MNNNAGGKDTLFSKLKVLKFCSRTQIIIQGKKKG